MVSLLCLLIWLVWRVGKRLYAWLRRPAEEPAPARAVATIIPPKRRRPLQRRPMLHRVRSHDSLRRPVYCGPTAVSAITAVDADALVRAIQRRRGNDQPVMGTHVDELYRACGEFGFKILLVGDLSGRPPTLASWERGRTYDEVHHASMLVVDNHWVVVRGWWLCDSFYSRSTPIRIRTPGAHQRTRVRHAYRIVKVDGKQPG